MNNLLYNLFTSENAARKNRDLVPVQVKMSKTREVTKSVFVEIMKIVITQIEGDYIRKKMEQ